MDAPVSAPAASTHAPAVREPDRQRAQRRGREPPLAAVADADDVHRVHQQEREHALQDGAAEPGHRHRDRRRRHSAPPACARKSSSSM